MYERSEERQVGFAVCKEEPGRAIAANGEPAAYEAE